MYRYQYRGLQAHLGLIKPTAAQTQTFCQILRSAFQAYLCSTIGNYRSHCLESQKTWIQFCIHDLCPVIK